MEDISIAILRFGLGITFLLTSYFIFRHTEEWSKMVPGWLGKILPLSKDKVIRGTAYYDLFNGIWLLTPFYTWIAAIFATLHLIEVLVTTGINDTTYRDIGLLFTSISLLLLTLPTNIQNYLIDLI